MENASAVSQAKQLTRNRDSFWRFAWRNKPLYIMLIPGMVYFLIFKYYPMLGSIIAFQDYNVFEGFGGSEWVGSKWFERMFATPQFMRLLENTIVISFYQIIFAFPAPIILASLLNEVRRMAFKRSVQTIVYLPHFLSWTIVYGLAYMMLSTQSGIVNIWIEQLGFGKINFLQSSEYFRSIVVGSGIWKEVGWSTIIFLAALSGINPTLYEAAKIDGASRWKQYWHITVPGLMPAIMILLLIKIGHVMDIGFEQVYVFLTPITYQTGDILDTYSYRAGIVGGQFSLTTAIGLFKSTVGFVLLILANYFSKRATGDGLY